MPNFFGPGGSGLLTKL